MGFPFLSQKIKMQAAIIANDELLMRSNRCKSGLGEKNP